ncbi:MAG: hypothetical protein LBT46_09520, partial [Planctomycetaceae bacterium]|nr:hypothetical protein [Planctomycetaceae bacterium]
MKLNWNLRAKKLNIPKDISTNLGTGLRRVLKTADWSLNPSRWGMDSAGEARKVQAKADAVNQKRPGSVNPNRFDAQNKADNSFVHNYVHQPNMFYDTNMSARENARGWAGAGGEMLGGTGGAIGGALGGTAVAPGVGTVAGGILGGYAGGKTGKTGAERLFDNWWKDDSQKSQQQPQQSILGHLGQNFESIGLGDAAYLAGPLAPTLKVVGKPLLKAVTQPIQASKALGQLGKSFKKGFANQSEVAQGAAHEMSRLAKNPSKVTDFGPNGSRYDFTPSHYYESKDFGLDPSLHNFGASPLSYETTKGISDGMRKVPGISGFDEGGTRYSQQFGPSTVNFTNEPSFRNSNASYTSDHKIHNSVGDGTGQGMRYHYSDPTTAGARAKFTQGHETGHSVQSPHMFSLIDDAHGGYAGPNNPQNYINSMALERDANNLGYQALQQAPDVISAEELKALRKANIWTGVRPMDDTAMSVYAP